MSLPPDDLLRRKVKAELRKRMRGLRNTAPASACLERSEKICARLAEHERVKTASSIALFWAIEQRHEVDLRSLDAQVRARGAKVAYPAIDPETNVMTFRFVADERELVERGFGFREPAPDASEASALDVIVVPALAVGPSGHRIGYGGGYYDRTLPRFSPPATSIAVAYDYQLLAEVPVEGHDVPVEWIVTDSRTLSCGR